MDENGELLKLFSPRSGYFDSQLTECGPPAILTKDGIVLLYNGKNEPGEKGDTAYPANSYCAGQALFDVNNPTKLIGRWISLSCNRRMILKKAVNTLRVPYSWKVWSITGINGICIMAVPIHSWLWPYRINN